MDTWEYDYINTCDPCLLPAKSTTSMYIGDNPFVQDGYVWPFPSKVLERMRIGLKTSVKFMKCWDLVPCTPNMKVIQSTWALKVKCYPDGSFKRFKTRFCTQGDQHHESIDFIETWSSGPR